MNDKIDILIKYYENLIEELNADQHSNPSYLLGRIDMAEEFISDLKGLKKELWYNSSMTKVKVHKFWVSATSSVGASKYKLFVAKSDFDRVVKELKKLKKEIW